jgi:lysophospholipase L1-like esterase
VLLILETLAVLACPITLGVMMGVLLRRLTGRRIASTAGALTCLMLPTAAAAVLTIRFPLIGLWDAITEGFLCGAGLLCAAHRFYADRRDVLLTAVSVLLAFLILEVGARLFLGTPPAYPVGEGPHFLLATVLRTIGPDSPTFHKGAIPPLLERIAMRGDPKAMAIADRPPSAMVTKEIVCSIAYGSAYQGVIDVSREREAVFPERLTPRPGAARRVLHIGDSMVYGANVPRDHTFIADLEKLEPAVQHINGGISGMAPDDYLVVLRSWIAREPVDLAVMYLFAGNDMVGLDAPHPCSNWQSILVYQDGRAGLRFPAAPKSDRGIAFKWLVINSPLPYLGRAMITWHSAAAAFLGGVLDSWPAYAARAEPQVQFQHLEAILRSARDELRDKQIPFVVVVLPHAQAIGEPNGASEQLSTEVRAITQRLGLPELDATEPIREALSRGEHPIQPDGSHFNEAGHWLMANWLHERLASTAGVTVN